jgi:hypothetical protein
MIGFLLLAGSGLGAVVDSDQVLGGLLGVTGLLGGHGDITVLGTLDADGLIEESWLGFRKFKGGLVRSAA